MDANGDCVHRHFCSRFLSLTVLGFVYGIFVVLLFSFCVHTCYQFVNVPLTFATTAYWFVFSIVSLVFVSVFLLLCFVPFMHDQRTFRFERIQSLQACCILEARGSGSTTPWL